MFSRKIAFLHAVVLVAVCIVMASCKPKPERSSNPHIVIDTQYGKIVCELYPDKAPHSVAAILHGVDSGFYERSSFYRVLREDNQVMGSWPATLIQGGLYATKNRRDYLPGIPHESTNLTGLTHRNGALSMARTDTGTARTEFFIVIEDQKGFDYGGRNNPDGQGYAVFGQVVEGMDVVLRVYRRPEYDQLFTPPVTIFSIKRE